MATSVIQPSFSAGELSPNLYARVDLAKYHIGAARAYNIFVDYRGGLTTRPGTRFVNFAGSPAGGGCRLVKFQFSITQTYVLEFGDHFMRVIKDGGMVLNEQGDPFVLITPWAAADLALLKFAQSNDVMTFTHPAYPIYDLSRLAENNWALSLVDFGAKIAPPPIVNASVAPTLTGLNTQYTYVVTSVDGDGNESLPSYVTGIACDSFSKREQTITIGWQAVAGASYYNVYKATPQNLVVGGTTDYVAAAQYGFITSSQGVQALDTNILPNYAKTPPIHRNPFAARAIVSVGVPNGGSGYRNADVLTVNDPTGTGFYGKLIVDQGTIRGIQIINGGMNYTNPSFSIATGAGTGAALTFNIGPADGLSPGVVTYFQQRKTFAASYRMPATYWMTQPGSFTNMDISLPVNDGNALTFTLAALEQNPIKYMVPVQNGLIMLTGGAAWLVSGGDNNSAITPNSVKQTPQVYNGCADVMPLLVGINLLYVQEKGYVVQDLKYDFYSNIYTGEDRTYLSSHMFVGRTIVDWCWAEQPHKLVWAVMNDGRLLIMTYIKEQEIYGWTQHETNGRVKAICSIPEGDEDAVYIIVDRPGDRRYIERVASRRHNTMLDAWTMDCALRYQGPPTTRVQGVPQADGEVVWAVIDGKVYNNIVVTGGGANLPIAGSNVLVGYPFAAEFDSLYLDTGDPTIQGKRKKINAVTLRIVEGRGLIAANRLDRAVVVKGDTDPINLYTRDLRVILDNDWNSAGQVFVRGSIGYPWTLTAIVPEVSLGDTRG